MAVEAYRGSNGFPKKRRIRFRWHVRIRSVPWQRNCLGVALLVRAVWCSYTDWRGWQRNGTSYLCAAELTGNNSSGSFQSKTSLMSLSMGVTPGVARLLTVASPSGPTARPPAARANSDYSRYDRSKRPQCWRCCLCPLILLHYWLVSEQAPEQKIRMWAKKYALSPK